MAIRQQNSEPIECGSFYGCRLLTMSDDGVDSSYSIWPSDDLGEWCEGEWCLSSIEAIDDLIDMLRELREVDEEDCK